MIIISGLYWNDWTLVTATLINAAALLVPFFLLKRRHLLAAGYILMFMVLAMVTLAATIGQGIHDFAIMAYPIVIIFASLALDRVGFRVIVLLALASMGWLVFGEAGGVFASKPYQTPGWIDFVVIGAILLTATMAVNLLAANMRKNLEKARQEIARRQKVEEELREKEVQCQALADSGTALIWTSGTDKLCNYFNIPWLKFTGRTLEQEMGNGWAEGVHPKDFERCLQTYVTAFDRRESFDMEYRLCHVSGEYRWLQDLGTPNYNSNKEFIGYIGHCFDITERKRADELLRYQSIHDVLTGIYNRTFFEAELVRFERGREFPVSIVVADVDGLKFVNDKLGHAAGDDLLKQAAAVLGGVFRAGDVLARIAGDEFAALLPDTNAAGVEQFVTRIRDCLVEQNTRHPDLPVQLSLGAATAEKNNLVATMTLADQRMYADKAARKSGVCQAAVN
jgi:diguanylate cyclase (GGDEF)-like protein/PAS domain S-box-containing protein